MTTGLPLTFEKIGLHDPGKSVLMCHQPCAQAGQENATYRDIEG